MSYLRGLADLYRIKKNENLYTNAVDVRYDRKEGNNTYGRVVNVKCAKELQVQTVQVS